MFWSDKLEGSRWYMQHACPEVTQHVLLIKCLLPHYVFAQHCFFTLTSYCVPIFCPTKALTNAVKQNERIFAGNGSFQNLSDFLALYCSRWRWPDILLKVKADDGSAGNKEDQTRPAFQVIKQCFKQEGTMCCENNVKYLGLRNFMTWTHVKWLHLYHTRMIVVVCLAPSPNTIPALWTQGKCSSM